MAFGIDVGRVDEIDAGLQRPRYERVDGILLIPADRVASAQALANVPAGLTIVQVDRATDRPVADFVGVDNEAGMQLLFQHLVECGVGSVGFAGADDATSAGVERWDAFHRLAAANGLEVRGGHRTNFSVESGTTAAEALLRAGPLPDAIVAGSDQIAVGVISRLREEGVEVPRDLLVTGFDGGELSRVYWPTLTTVVQPTRSIAADAVGLLTGRIDGDLGAVRRNRLMPELQLGTSTGHGGSRTA